MEAQDLGGWTVVKSDGSTANTTTVTAPAPEATPAAGGWTILRANGQSSPPPAPEPGDIDSEAEPGQHPDSFYGAQPARYGRDANGRLVSKWNGSGWVDLHNGKQVGAPAREEGSSQPVPGMERLGGAAPGVPRPPIPQGLQTAEQQRAQRPMQRSRTGTLFQEPAFGQSVFDIPAEGVARDIPEGVAQMAEPGLPEKAEGARKIISGVTKAGSVALPAAALEAPVGLAVTMAGSTAAQKGAEAGLSAVGVRPEYAGLAGDVAGLLAAAGGTGYLLRKAYVAAGSPEVKIGGTFAEPKPFSEMTDEELVSHANSIAQNPPKNYDWQKQEIVKEALKRQAARGMGTGEQPQPAGPAPQPEPQPAHPQGDEDFGAFGRGIPSTEAEAGTPVPGGEGWTVTRAGETQPSTPETQPAAGETPPPETAAPEQQPATQNATQNEEPKREVTPAGDGWQIVRAQPETAQEVPPPQAGAETGGNIAPSGGPTAQARADEGTALPEPRRPSNPEGVGQATLVRVPGENRSFSGQYAVRELDDVHPSHNPFSFEPNPNYQHTNDRNYSDAKNSERVIRQAQQFDPAYLLSNSPTAEHGAPVIDSNGNVLGGNSRTMTLARVYAENGDAAQSYRHSLEQSAQQFGVDPAAVASMRQPVLVRRLDGEVDPQAAITDLNKTGAAALTPAERAISDSRRLSDQTLDFLTSKIEAQGEGGTLAQALEGPAGAQVVNRLVDDGIITPQEKPQYTDERGVLTAEGKQRISRLMVGRLFRDSSQFENTPPDLRNKLERAVAPLARLSGRTDWDITPQVQEAVDLLAEARAHGIRNVGDLQAQQGMFGEAPHYSPAAYAIASKLQEGPRKVAQAFSQYAHDEILSRPGQPATFMEPPTRGEAFSMAFGGGERLAQGARRLKTSPSMFSRVGETSPMGNGYWIDGGKVYPVGTELHAQYMEKAMPGTLFGDIVKRKLEEGAIRVRGENIETHQSGLSSRNFEPAVEQAVKEAGRKHVGNIGVEVQGADGIRQYLQVPLRDVPELLDAPAKYIRANRFAGISGAYRQPELKPLAQKFREQDYSLRASNGWHASRAEVEPITLDHRYGSIADAYLTSMSGMELVGRASNFAKDEAVLNYQGLHVSPSHLPTLVENLGRMLSVAAAEDPTKVPAGAERLYNAAVRAKAAGKSLVVVEDSPEAEPEQNITLLEELGHAVQATITGSARGAHAGREMEIFRKTPAYQQAAINLLSSSGKAYASSGQEGIMTEVGVRLMFSAGRADLRLSLPEARSLGALYVRSLRRQHGTRQARSIATEVFAALRRPTRGGQEEPDGGNRGLRPGRRGGTVPRDGPDTSPSARKRGSPPGNLGGPPKEAAGSGGGQPPGGTVPEPALFDEIALNRTKANAQIDNATRDLARRQSELPDKGFGERLRTFVTGTRDVEIAGTNQLRDQLRKALPAGVDQEALTLMRDFKRRPGELRQFLNGTHPYYAEVREPAAAIERVQSARAAIERALSPSPQMEAADRVLTQYFTDHLDDGKQLGFIESNVSNDEYITHLLQPRTAEDEVAKRLARGPRLGPRQFKFAKTRFYPTVLHAIANGLKPRTLNSLDALAVYGDRFATTKAARVLVDQLKDSGLGRWDTPSGQRQGDVPRDWVELAPESRMFRNEVPFTTSVGQPAVMHQMFFVAPQVAEALRPIYERSNLNTVPGVALSRTYQNYLKAVELGMSVFHIKALNMMGLSSMGPQGLAEALRADMADDEFLHQEREWVRDGLTTPILGRTWEAYRALQPTAVPTRLDLLRQWPVVRQADRLSGKISEFTFGTLQRKLKVVNASMLDAAWMAEHPRGTAMQRAEARRGIAKYVNAVYGGLNWENMGVNRLSLELSRMFLLAPDWTFSNAANAKYALFGSSHVPEDIGGEGVGPDRDPGAKAARLFWLKAATWAFGLTAATTAFLAAMHRRDTAAAMKHWLDDPTQVYLGDDDQGRTIRQNMFFTGAPGDFATAVKNTLKFGAPVGLARTLANKMGPLARTGEQLLSNTNEFGQPIVQQRAAKGAAPPGFAEKTALGAEQAAKNLAPAPFSVTTIVKMLLDRKREYTPEEYGFTLLNSRAPTHEAQPKEARPAGTVLRVHRATPAPSGPPLFPAAPRPRLPRQ